MIASECRPFKIRTDRQGASPGSMDYINKLIFKMGIKF